MPKEANQSSFVRNSKKGKLQKCQKKIIAFKNKSLLVIF